MARSYEAVVQFALDALPHGPAIGLDHHAALYHLGRLRHVALNDNVLIPGRKIFFSGSDGRFGHGLFGGVLFTIAAISPSTVCGSASASTSRPHSRTVCDVIGPIDAILTPR